MFHGYEFQIWTKYLDLFISANQEKNLTSRLECIADFFNICFRAMNSFKADKIGQLFPSGDDMGYPIIKYMAKYYLRHFKGMFNLYAKSSIIHGMSILMSKPYGQLVFWQPWSTENRIEGSSSIFLTWICSFSMFGQWRKKSAYAKVSYFWW